ncbi:MAG: class E sortase [Ilumatobacteraceae bacterium]
MSASRWDSPPPPHDWRWVVGTIGKVLIATGLLMFGFVAYQLWGTGLEYAQAQDRLDGEFEQLLAGTPATTSSSSTTSTSATPTTPEGTTIGTPPTTATVPETTAPPTTIPVPVFAEGDVMAQIEIPSIGLEAKVVYGVQVADLKNGPGHYPDTPMPGQLGNSAIAGHRTTYGQPFFRLDEVAPGDEIVLTTVQGRFVYRMTGNEVVGADRSDVVATTDPTVARLTLTTCHPRYTAAQRLIVYAELDVEASSSAPLPAVVATQPDPTATLPGEPVASSVPTETTVAADDPTVTAVTAATTPEATAAPETSVTSTVPAEATGDDDGNDAGPSEVAEETADAFSHGWFSDDGAPLQVGLWGLALAAIGIGSWLLSRRVRRNWVGALVGIVPFALVLYFFFQNVNRLLPAAL